MASPQKEDGFTPIANELLEALYRKDVLGRDARTVLWLIRQTYGWQRKDTPVSAYRLSTETGMDYRNAKYAIKRLRDRNILDDNSLIKDYDQWGTKGSREQNIPGKKSSPKGGKKVPHAPYSKERKEREKGGTFYSPQRHEYLLPGFDEFWALYPKKTAEEVCRGLWKRNVRDMSVAAKVILDVKAKRDSRQWTENSRQHCPSSKTYLYECRWNDKIEPTQEDDSGIFE